MGDAATTDLDHDLDRIAQRLRAAERVVVLTGAGISTGSGIPDFRGPEGLWTKNPEAEKLATIDHYMAHRDHRARAWRNRLESSMWEARPNAAHEAVAELERRHAVTTLVTQNVDGLHQMAGTSPEIVIEIHGTVHEAKCMRCGWRGPMEPVLARVRAGEEDPDCTECGGILKSATISFGESLVPEDLEAAQLAAASCDLFLALGTSLGVYPAAGLPELALRAGAGLVICNAQPTPYDGLAEAVRHEPLEEILPLVAARV